MPAVAICICTLDRPDGLRSVLNALDAQRLTCDLQIIIVDNSASRSAETVFADYSKTGRFAATFVHEKHKGLSNARNAALEKALDLNVEFFGFTDDDDVPLPDWVETLVTTAIETGAAAVVGPVYPLFAEPPPEWAAGLFVRVSSLSGGATANCLVSCAAVNRLNLRFDPRFNETGGEDTCFFHELVKAGEHIAWAEAAIVMEQIPKHQMTRKWLLKRWCQTGATEAALDGKFVSLLKGLARIGVGLLLVAKAFILRQDAFAQCYTIARGCGMILEAIGTPPKRSSPFTSTE